MRYRLAVMFVVALAAVSTNGVGSDILRHNPFEQPDMADGVWGKQAKEGAIMQLRGTVVDGSDSIANIDGEYYQLDHEVSGYRVIRIDSGSVTLSRGGIEMVLTLQDDE